MSVIIAVMEKEEPMRAIDADELKKKAFGKRGGLIHTADIDAMPTIEERKTGKWIWKTLDVYKCSECETETHVDECMGEPIYNFCPYCGARMVQEEGSNDN